MNYAMDYEDDEADQLRAQSALDRRIFLQLIRHPGPRDPDYPLGDEAGDTEEEADTHERLRECAEQCQQWLFAMKKALSNGQVGDAWQALEELQCEAAQMLEDHP